MLLLNASNVIISRSLHQDRKYIMRIPASGHQERLWLIDKFETGKLYPANPVYHNLPLVFRFNGRLDYDALNKSFQQLIDRHEVLRTTLHSFDDSLYQCVNVSLLVEVTVLPRLPEGSKAEWLHRLHEYIKTPFPTDQNLLIRCGVLQLADMEYLVAIVAHHIVADRWSMRLLARELLQNYHSFQRGQGPAQLPAVSLHYSDFSLWQSSLPEEVLDEQWLFWKKKLKGKLQEIDLPTRLNKPKIQVYDGASITFSLPFECVEVIKEASKKLNADHRSILLAAFKVLLQKYTGKEEVVIGTFNNYRHLPEAEYVVGPLANLVTVRSFIRSEDRFSDVAQMVTDTLMEGIDNGLLPFERLVTRLRTTTDVGRTALFDVLFHYEKDFGSEFTQSDLLGEIEIMETNLGLGKYDLNLLMVDSGTLISGVLVFNQKYYEKETAQRLVEHYQHLLNVLSANSGMSIRSHALVTGDEKKQLDEWNNTSTSFPSSSNLIELFEEQVFRYPEHVALVHENTSITYAALSKEVTRIAARLQRHYQVNNNAFVGLMLDNSPLLIASVLGILKAGGAYVPVDPAYPAERINYVLNDSACKVVVTSTNYLQKLDKFNGELCDAAWLANEAGTDFEVVEQSNHIPDDIAYLLYTSGTTGRPKGCKVTHKNVVRLIRNDAFPFEISSNDVWVMGSSICFDVSVWEIFGALLHGGKVVIPNRETVRDTNKFYELIKAQRVTVLNQTPSAFYQFIETARRDDNKGLDQYLRYVIFAGDKLEMFYLRDWITIYPPSVVRLINMYGITETTVHVTHYQVTESDILAETTTSCIGIPLPETKVYVLDEDLNLSPIGVPGEMYVGGTGVSAGYWNNSELTAKRFVSSPFNEKEILYRSGDLACWNSSGNLEYIGRIDSQVKIRGFRVELSEIERTLLSMDVIRETRVLLQDHNNNKLLVAYLVTNGNLDIDRVKNYLLQMLPDYMVPSHYIQLDKIPLNSNGKLDKGKLPAIRVQVTRAYDEPKNPTEKMLCALFEEELGLDHISTKDSFFELGGHSLKAMKLISRIYEAFKVKLELSSVFNYPTVESLAHHVKGLPTEVHWQFHRLEQQEFYEASHGQQRYWVLHQMDESRTSMNMAAGCRLAGNLNVDMFTSAFAAVIQRHEILRTTFDVIDSALVQKVHPHPLGPVLTYRDLRNNASQEQLIAEWKHAIATTIFDLDHGPLLTATLLRIADDIYVFLFNIHHIVADGWSLDVIKKELFTLYSAKSTGTEGNLEPLSFQYKEYARWQREMAKNWKMGREYWHNYLSGDISPLLLTTDFARHEVPTFRGKRLNFTIEKATAEGLSKLCTRHDVTLFMLLLAVVKILLHRYTGQKDILVGLPVSGRDHKNLEDQVGLYLNTLVIRTSFEEHTTLSDLLTQVKHNLLEAYKHQLYPFDLLVEELISERDNMGHSPFFDVVVQLQHEGEERHGIHEQIEGLSISDLEMNTSSSKNELTFFFNQSAECLELCIEYNSDLYKENYIKEMRDNFLHMLSQVTTIENVLVSSDELLLEEGREEHGGFDSSSITF